MKPVKLFYLKNCPFCRKALRYIEQAKAAFLEALKRKGAV